LERTTRLCTNHGVVIWPFPRDVAACARRIEFFNTLRELDDFKENVPVLERVPDQATGKEHLRRSGDDARVLRREYSRDGGYLYLPAEYDGSSIPRFQDNFTHTGPVDGRKPRFYSIKYNAEHRNKGEVHALFVRGKLRCAYHYHTDEVPGGEVTNWSVTAVRGLMPREYLRYIFRAWLYPDVL
jgi:hypothetical protein